MQSIGDSEEKLRRSCRSLAADFVFEIRGAL